MNGDVALVLLRLLAAGSSASLGLSLMEAPSPNKSRASRVLQSKPEAVS